MQQPKFRNGVILPLSILLIGYLTILWLISPPLAIAQEPDEPTPDPSSTVTPQPPNTPANAQTILPPKPPRPFDPSKFQPGQPLPGADYPAEPLPVPRPFIGIEEMPEGVDLDVTFISRDPKYNRYWLDYPGGTGHKPVLYPGTENDKRWPNPGELVTFTAHIINKGTVASGPFKYTWYIDGVEVETGTLASLPPQQEAVTTYQWAWAHQVNGEPVLDDHIIRFVVDPQNQIHETFENNNQFENLTNAI